MCPFCGVWSTGRDVWEQEFDSSLPPLQLRRRQYIEKMSKRRIRKGFNFNDSVHICSCTHENKLVSPKASVL